jgi:hypothetical protein
MISTVMDVQAAWTPMPISTSLSELRPPPRQAPARAERAGRA